jgi:hypothetical protein
MAFELVLPRIRGTRRQVQTRLGSHPGTDLQSHLVGPCGQYGVAFPVRLVSMTPDPLTLAAVVKTSQALSTSLTRMAVVVCPSAMGAV